jgi:hypothetical protein
MNYNELSDDEIDMLIALRADGWKLSEESAYSRLDGTCARVTWNDGTRRERWVPHYTSNFGEVIGAAQHLLNTNERAIEPFVNGLNLTYNASISRFIGEATPRALCILILEALDEADTPTRNADGVPFEVCTECTPNHIDNCCTCIGYGLSVDGSLIKAGSAGASIPFIKCPECGGTPAGYVAAAEGNPNETN